LNKNEAEKQVIERNFVFLAILLPYAAFSSFSYTLM